PRRVRAVPEAVEAIRGADLILLGPGSLYTSILPNLLIPEIAHAIRRSKAQRVYISNLMTQPGETTGYSLSQHLSAIERHVPGQIVDVVVANRKNVSPDVARRYLKEGAERVIVDLPVLRKQRVKVIFDSLLEEHGVIRHDSKRLARLLLEEFPAPR
ncbi:MAG TPA: 2-phospho-L-lactate transferase CofD family protein, partial [Candidatus Acidoferrum sp.]|nr:2-phospho-L-lactate transferase CofD family protein [Candidatus Acidoferrum sp.]